MSNINLNLVQSASALAGLRDMGTVDTSGSVSTRVLVSPGDTYDQDINIPLSKLDAPSIVRINPTGMSAPISTYWYPICGVLTINDITAGIIYIFTLTSASNGRNLHFRAYNNKAAASATIPNLTISIHAHLYDFPF